MKKNKFLMLVLAVITVFGLAFASPKKVFAAQKEYKGPKESGYSNRNEMITDFLTDFYTFLLDEGALTSSLTSLSDFMHGPGKISGFNGMYGIYNDSTVYFDYLYNTDFNNPSYKDVLPDADKFINKAEYNNWVPLLDLLEEYTQLGEQSFWGSKFTGARRIVHFVREEKPTGAWVDVSISVVKEITGRIPEELKVKKEQFIEFDLINMQVRKDYIHYFNNLQSRYDEGYDTINVQAFDSNYNLLSGDYLFHLEFTEDYRNLTINVVKGDKIGQFGINKNSDWKIEETGDSLPEAIFRWHYSDFVNHIKVDNLKWEKIESWEPSKMDNPIFDLEFNENENFIFNEDDPKDGKDRQIVFDLETFYKVEIESSNENSGIVSISASDNSRLFLKNEDIFRVSKDEFEMGNMLIISFDTYLKGYFSFHNAEKITFYKGIVDDEAPIINGPESYTINIDESVLISDLLKNYTAFDEIDGDVTDTITVINDNYTPNRNVLNIAHKVTIKATDSTDNSVLFDFFVKVVDTTAPKITGNSSTATISYNLIWGVNNFKASLVVTDNHSLLTTDDIKVIENNYLNNNKKLGTYKIVFEVKDASGNKATFEKYVKVVDDIPADLLGPEEIITSVNTMLTRSDILKLIQAYDEIDGNLTSRIRIIEDNYSGNGHKKGIYTVILEVEDNAGNKTTKIISINRRLDLKDNIYIHDKTKIILNNDTKLDFEDLIDILVITEAVIVDANTEFFLYEEDYFGNEEQVGVYTVIIESKSLSGMETDHELKIEVREAPISGIGRTPSEIAKDLFKNPFFITIIVGASVFGVYFIYKVMKKRK